MLPKWRCGDSKVVDCGEKAVGAVFGFSKVAMYSLFLQSSSSISKAMVSPPWCGVVAGLMPISSRVGTEKVPFGPARAEYDLSLKFRAPALMSGLSSG